MKLSRAVACFGSVLALLAAAGCVPSTYFARVAVDYRPSPNANVQMNRVSGSAISYSESDADTLDRAGALYLGELDVYGLRGGMVSGGAGAGNLSGRASLEAAQRGATHFMLISSDIDQVYAGTAVVVSRYGAAAVARSDQQITARYALLRVDRARWEELPATLRPITSS